MTKENYMALADFQTLWTSSIKPWIVAGFIAVTAVESGATPKLVLQDGSLIEQSTFQPAGDYITKVAAGSATASNLVLADGSNIAQSTFIPASEKGANSGVATLGADGKVPSSQLPSFVDDVIEAANFAALPATGEAGKIYVTLDDNKTYRWGGSAYVEISASLALGETQGTAYEGSKGKANADAIANLQSDKADKDEDAVEGNFAAFDANGNPVDSGHKHSDYITSHQDISGKADKVASATAGNFAGLDANGNLTDSGKNAADFATAAQGTKADSAIQSVKVNGTALTPDANKAVDIEVPNRVTAAELATFVV